MRISKKCIYLNELFLSDKCFIYFPKNDISTETTLLRMKRSMNHIFQGVYKEFAMQNELKVKIKKHEIKILPLIFKPEMYLLLQLLFIGLNKTFDLFLTLYVIYI